MWTFLYLAVMTGMLVFYARRLLASPEEAVTFTLFIGALAAGFGLIGYGVEGLFGVIRLQGLGIFVVCPTWCLIAAWLVRADQPRVAAAHALLALTAIAIGIDTYLYEPTALQVNYLEVSTSKRDTPLRIAVLSDIQTDDVGAYERTAIRRAMATKPDIVLLPGDYVQGLTEADYDTLMPALRDVFVEERLGAPLGAWAVQGNAEMPHRWVEMFDGVPVVPVTETTRIQGEGFQLTALSLADSFDTSLEIPTGSTFHIVFGHGPDFSEGAVMADLLIAGHTHGGQVRLPLLGPLLTFSTIPRSRSAGLTELDAERTLVVSRGIGMERAYAPRLRFLCRPEVVIIDVLPER